jgi:two-component system chemotaxis response regulator CheY
MRLNLIIFSNGLAMIMKKKILVLDDCSFMLTVIGDMLTNLNYEVTTADSGLLACQKAESTRYDMIIADMNMPVMDGIEFTKQVKKYPSCKFVPVVMLSSEQNKDKISEARKVGVSTFLSKPLNEKQLKTILQITLNKRRASRIPFRLEVSYGEDEILADYTESFTFNVSAGGLFLETKSPLPLGEALKLKLELPENNRAVHCEGRVAWVNSTTSPIRSDHPAGMGVEFLCIEEERLFQDFLQGNNRKR